MSVIKKLSGEAIVAFHVAYAKLPGSDPMCALFLSQVSYWCARSEDGVAWITHQAMYDQTGMSRKQQDRAAAYWVSMGIMEKFIKGIPPKIHYFVDFEKLEQLILDAQFQKNDMSERDNLDVRKGQQVLSERGKTSREDSRDSSDTQAADEQQAAPAPSSPEKSHTKSKAQTGMERELSLKERLVDVWNASCTQAKAKTGRCLPSCRVFPAGALPSMKTYMRIYSDDEILHLLTEGSFRVQRDDFYHSHGYSMVNLMRNLEANASLPATAKAAPAMTETPTDLSSFLTSPDRAKNEEEVPEAGRGTILATNPDDIWDLP